MLFRRMIAAGVVAILTTIATPSDAKTRTDDFVAPDKHAVVYGGYSIAPQQIRQTKKRHSKAKPAKRMASQATGKRAYAIRAAGVSHVAQIVDHPPGCPHRAFCGCGVALRLLGTAVRAGGLAIAANWGGFPRTACAPGMAAWRRGHVRAIEHCLPGNMALFYDPNSGGRKTRLHVASLAGYQIVNPHGAYTEVNGKPGRSYRSHRYARYAKRYKRYAVAR